MKPLQTGISVLAVAAVLLGCERERDAAVEGPGRRAERITHFSEHTELFVEFPVLVRDEQSPFAVHLTRLDDFEPVENGRVTIVLEDGELPTERFEVTAPTLPGIFRPVAEPRQAGQRMLVVLLEDQGRVDRHELGRITVHPNLATAESAEIEEHAGDGVTFLKEQQWRIDFGTTPAREHVFRASLVANGFIRARPDGEVRVSAPVSGRVVTVGMSFPRLGLAVKKDETLALIAPKVSGDADIASLELELSRAGLRHSRAHRERNRMEGLATHDAVPRRRLQEARDEEEAAHAEVEAAERRIAQYHGTQRASGGAAPGRVTVRSPITGTVVEVSITPGAFVDEGQPMFHVVDLDRVWLEVQIPEADIAQVRDVHGAWFEIEGYDEPFEISDERGGRLVALGGMIDPERRTIPLVFELENPGRELRVGMFARVRVLSQASRLGVAVPRSAVVDEGGEAVVYVQQGGETFARRIVRLGWHDKDLVEVLERLAPGERVVTRGAYQVRLAASTTGLPANGHAH